MRQRELFEDFIEDCRESALPDEAFSLGRCVGCGHLIPEDELRRGGGFCLDCAAPIEDDDEKEN